MTPLPYSESSFNEHYGTFGISWYFNYTQVVSLYGNKYNIAPRTHRCNQNISNSENAEVQFVDVGCIVLIDTEREKEIGLGKDYPFGKLGPGECVLHSIWQEKYGLEIGSKITISLIISTMQDLLGDQVYNPLAEENGWEIAQNVTSLNTTFPCTIAGFFSEAYGKFHKYGAEPMIILESDQFLAYTSDYLPGG